MSSFSLYVTSTPLALVLTEQTNILQEIRECVCSRRTQHSHGNASSSASIPRLRSTMRTYSSLLLPA
ncbi:hypothetical protein NQZ68_004350 [Dissostichus eleginoides]|nr:hypothetical protein NQZ68_004350 [Dissostichus eleginoides]